MISNRYASEFPYTQCGLEALRDNNDYDAISARIEPLQGTPRDPKQVRSVSLVASMSHSVFALGFLM